jgi:hypothetical protein
MRIADCGLRIILLTAEAQRTQRYLGVGALGIRDWHLLRTAYCVRSNPQSAIRNPQSAIESATTPLEVTGWLLN